MPTQKRRGSNANTKVKRYIFEQMHKTDTLRSSKEAKTIDAWYDMALQGARTWGSLAFLAPHFSKAA